MWAAADSDLSDCEEHFATKKRKKATYGKSLKHVETMNQMNFLNVIHTNGKLSNENDASKY